MNLDNFFARLEQAVEQTNKQTKKMSERLLLEISLEEQEQAWQEIEKQQYSYEHQYWNAGSNYLCLSRFLDYLIQQPDLKNEAVTIKPSLEDLQKLWKTINGSRIKLGETKIVLIPTEEDTETLKVHEDWVDLPDLAGHYYGLVQINLEGEEEGSLKIVGFVSHPKLKTEGKYDESQRRYYLDGTHLLSLNSMLVAREFCPPAIDLGEDLSKWFEGNFGKDWLTFTKIPALSHRGITRSSSPSNRELVKRAKVIDLQGQLVALIVHLKSLPEQKTHILLQVEPIDNRAYLPEGLQLTVTDSAGKIVGQTHARKADNWLQLELESTPNTKFSVKVALADVCIREDFVIGKANIEETTSAAISQVEQNVVYLHQWFEGWFSGGWQPEEVARRSKLVLDKESRQIKARGDNDSTVNGAKIIKLGMDIKTETVVLILRQKQLNENSVDIRLRLYPNADSLYLPSGVKLTVLDEGDRPYPSLDAQAKAGDNWLQLHFTGQAGDKFKIRVALKENSLTEEFVI